MLAHTRRVDQANRTLHALAARPHPVDGDTVAGNARFRPGQQAIFAQQPVDERGLARIGAADDGELERRALVILVKFPLVGRVILPLDMGEEGLEQIGHALAMFGRKGDGFAQPQAEGFHHAIIGGLTFRLVGDQNDRHVIAAQPAGDFLVQRRDPCARVDHEQRDVAIFHRRFSLHPHPAGQAVGVLIFITGGVDDGEVEAEQMRLALTPVAGDAGLVVDQRELLADQAVEQGGLAHIGPPDNGYDGQHGGPFPSYLKNAMLLRRQKPSPKAEELGFCLRRSMA